MTESLRQHIERLLPLEDEAFEIELNDMLRLRWPQLRRMGAQLCRQHGRAPSDYGEDFTSIVAMELAGMVRTYRKDPSKLDAVRKVDVMAVTRARNVARSWINSSEMPATGMSSRLLVHVLLQSLYWEVYSQSGQEPSVAEVVRLHNEKMHATRKDPARSGVLATEADFWLAPSAVEIPEHLSQTDFGIDPDCLISPMEGPRFRADVVAACAEHSHRAGLAAEAFIDYIDSGGDESGALGAVASALGAGREDAEETFGLVQQIAREVALGQWGVERP